MIDHRQTTDSGIKELLNYLTDNFLMCAQSVINEPSGVLAHLSPSELIRYQFSNTLQLMNGCIEHILILRRDDLDLIHSKDGKKEFIPIFTMGELVDTDACVVQVTLRLVVKELEFRINPLFINYLIKSNKQIEKIGLTNIVYEPTENVTDPGDWVKRASPVLTFIHDVIRLIGEAKKFFCLT